MTGRFDYKKLKNLRKAGDVSNTKEKIDCKKNIFQSINILNIQKIVIYQ